jgi:hypothetical protein
MEINTNQCINAWADANWLLKKLLRKEKDRLRKKDLYLYCGGEIHQAQDCPMKAAVLKLHKVRNVQ